MKLLCVIDYQKDFVSGALGFEAAQGLEGGIDALITRTLAQGGKVLFTKDTHPENYLETREGKFLPVPHCIVGTDGHELEGALAKYENGGENILILEKPTFGCANIADAARELCGGEPESITFCGVVTNICVLSNAVLLHSAFLDADIRIAENLCSALPPAHENAIEIMRGLGFEMVQE